MAALTAAAAALGVRARCQVGTLIAGASGRTKMVEVDGADQGALNRLLGHRSRRSHLSRTEPLRQPGFTHAAV